MMDEYYFIGYFMALLGGFFIGMGVREMIFKKQKEQIIDWVEKEIRKRIFDEIINPKE